MMAKVKCSGMRTPSKSKRLNKCKVPISPAQSKAKKVTLKYKRGYRKSPGKVARTLEALKDIDNGLSVCKAAKKFGFSESFLRRRVNGEVNIDSRNGPTPVFSSQEEIEMAKWLSEMSKRGMGLGPGDFLDFVQGIIKSEKRKTDFVNDRPSYTWYYSFMARNSHLVEKRQESSLENSRAKVTSEQLDKWFSGYYNFLSELHLLDKPHRVYNADESGFAMGSKASVVIGPTRKEYPDNLPHLCGQSKKRLTGMFCGNAEGDIIPPFLVYPLPKPTAFDPLISSRKGTVIEYTEKGWMNSKTFMKFLKHFHQYASQERPVLLIIDSVSSHIDLDVFTFAKQNQIELYRLIPNATHFLQPLDNGVFGPLKKVWYKIVRKFTKENPGKSIGKENFAGKLHEAFLQFYKPLTVANSFKSTGIHPVDRSKIKDNILKPALTFQPEPKLLEPSTSGREVSFECSSMEKEVEPSSSRREVSFECSSMEKEVEQSTSRKFICTECSSRDKDSMSLVSSSEDSPQNSNNLSGLSLLADIALIDCNNNDICKNVTCDSSDITCDTSSSCVNSSLNCTETCKKIQSSSNCCGEDVSLHLKKALVFPSCSYDVLKKKRKSTSDQPDCLTSSESIRTSALKKIESVKKFARKEIQAKKKYFKAQADKVLKDKKILTKKSKLINNKKSSRVSKGKSTSSAKKSRNVKKFIDFNVNSENCVVCKLLTEDDLGWIQCDLCDSWLHVACIPDDHDYDKRALSQENVDFYCHICVT